MSKGGLMLSSPVSSQPGLRAKIKKKVERLALRCPYTVEWPRIPHEFSSMMLAEIESQFTESFCDEKRDRIADSGNISGTYSRIKNHRKYLVVGINAVTKALEKSSLRLLLVCRSVRPKHMTEHLIILSQIRGCQACALPRLSATAAPLLGIRSALAIGFKNDPCDQKMADLISFLEDKIPVIEIPWIRRTLERGKKKVESSSSDRAIPQSNERSNDGGGEEPLPFLSEVPWNAQEAQNLDARPDEHIASADTSVTYVQEALPTLQELRVKRCISKDSNLTKKERRAKRKLEKKDLVIPKKRKK